MKSVAELALEAGVQLSGKGVVLEFLTTEKLDRLLALHKAEVIKELCAGVEPVAWRTFDGEGGYYFREFGMNENFQSEWNARNQKYAGWVDALYPAETVAALQARVAAQQAKIDMLMLEYCPDEMTPEQLEEWGKHQRVSTANEETRAKLSPAERRAKGEDYCPKCYTFGHQHRKDCSEALRSKK